MTPKPKDGAYLGQTLNTPISQLVAARLREKKIQFFANDNIAEHLEDGEIEAIEAEVMAAAETMLKALVIDTENDHNSKDTAKRIAKMMMREIYRGRYDAAPTITDFPNASNLDQVYVVGPVTVRSACSHHHVPIVGQVWLGIHPGDRVMGLSKFHRLADWIFSRPSIQEESTIQLADAIEKLVAPKGIAVVVKAKHLCCSHRGVKDDGTWMTTSVMRGTLRETESLKAEFLSLARASGMGN